VPGMLHCFTGSGAELQECLALGLHIGITGWVRAPGPLCLRCARATSAALRVCGRQRAGARSRHDPGRTWQREQPPTLPLAAAASCTPCTHRWLMSGRSVGALSWLRCCPAYHTTG
jgi:hypothetical protein